MNVSHPYTLPYLPVQRLGLWQCGGLQRDEAFDDRNAADRWFGGDSDYKSRGGETVADERLTTLQDKRLSLAGDLGWSLGFATAYCYRWLNSNRFAVVAAINNARRVSLNIRTPFMLFDTLDKALFNGKLSGMVLLVWKAMGTSHPGTTNATRIAARRICIQLNSTPFEERTAGMHGLMEMLIHHMIHAYLLVCCGAQKSDEKQDGRLLDGLHFGVILSTINDITLDCQEGSLRLSFHAAQRNPTINKRFMKGRGAYISLNPVGMSLPPPVADGTSHCMHDNRNITRAQVMNWQVQEYAKSIGDDWESRGETVFFWIHGQHQQLRRLEGPPSKFYHEIIWDNKRFAVPKERAAKYAAMMKLTNDNKYSDMKLPDCSAKVFDCLWKFVTYGGYHSHESHGDSETQQRSRAGPPVLLSPHSQQGDSLKIHIQVCKLADAMRFPELQQYALRRLYEVPFTSDDPIAMLRDIYDPSKALSIELQSWARKFLARTDEGSRDYRSAVQQGLSNYEKIFDWHQGRFTDIYTQYAPLRDDCKLVVASLTSGINPNDERGAFEEHPRLDKEQHFINNRRPKRHAVPIDISRMPFRDAFC